MPKNNSLNKSYTTEFKENAVNLVKQGEQSMSQTARNLGIPLSTLDAWMKKFSPNQANSNSRKTSPSVKFKQNNLEHQVTELQKINRRLSMERDILKKAVAYFAEVPK